MLKETVHKNLAAGINKVEHGRVKFIQNDEGKWNCTIIDKDDVEFNASNTIDAEAFMIGDLKFLSTILGKENFDGQWCYLCKLFYSEWQKGDVCGIPWTLKDLIAQSEKSKHCDGKERMGVREIPFFDIPVMRYIWPILHTLIGIGNAIMKNLIDIVESEIQVVPTREIRLRREVRELAAEIMELMMEKEYWMSKEEGTGSALLSEYKKERNKLIRKMDSLDEDDNVEYR